MSSINPSKEDGHERKRDKKAKEKQQIYSDDSEEEVKVKKDDDGNAYLEVTEHKRVTIKKY